MDNTFRTKYHHRFHDLWGEVVGAVKYNKKEWQSLDNMLWDAWAKRDEVKAERVLKLATQLRDEQKDSDPPA